MRTIRLSEEIAVDMAGSRATYYQMLGRLAGSDAVQAIAGLYMDYSYAWGGDEQRGGELAYIPVVMCATRGAANAIRAAIGEEPREETLGGRAFYIFHPLAEAAVRDDDPACATKMADAEARLAALLTRP